MKNIHKELFLTAAAALLLCGAAAAAPADPVFNAMKDEMGRSMDKLKMGELQKPYFISYTVADSTALYIAATFGSLEGVTSYPYRRVKAEVRVGDAKFDSSGFASNARGYTPSVDYAAPMGSDYDSLRFALWSLTDSAYKEALDNYSKKKAFVESKNITELYADLTPETPHTAVSGAEPAPFNADLWKERVRALSAVFKKYPAVKVSQVYLSREAGVNRFINSEGSEFRQPRCSGMLELNGRTYTADGYKLGAGARYGFCSEADLPSYEALLKKADELGARLTAMSVSVPMKAYIGPVLFEGSAAGKFFDHFFVSNVAYPREIWKESSKWSPDAVYSKAGQLVERLDMRVMPPFLNVVDDPSAVSYNGMALNGHYDVDDEGVPAGRLTLVEKGKLKDIYRYRAATRDFSASNGHGRGEVTEHVTGAPGNVFIKPADNPARVLPMPELRKKFLDLCREQELDYCLLVRDLGGFGGAFSAYKVYVADGREESVHAIEFTGSSLRALRDITAVSKEMDVYPLSWTPPASLVAPAVLVQEMEVKKTEQKPDRKPYLEHPYFVK
jgi:hypothetical protein